MKKVASMVLVGLFLLNSCGYFFIFSLNREIFRNEMRSLIHAGYFKDHYEKITLENNSPNTDFRWVDKNEFRYRGKLYDLVSMEIRGTTLEMTCINDQKEETLMASHEQFRNILSDPSSHAKTRNTRALQAMVIKQALLKNYLLNPPAVNGEMTFPDPLTDLRSTPLSPFFHPPRVV